MPVYRESVMMILEIEPQFNRRVTIMKLDLVDRRPFLMQNISPRQPGSNFSLLCLSKLNFKLLEFLLWKQFCPLLQFLIKEGKKKNYAISHKEIFSIFKLSSFNFFKFLIAVISLGFRPCQSVTDRPSKINFLDFNKELLTFLIIIVSQHDAIKISIKVSYKEIFAHPVSPWVLLVRRWAGGQFYELYYI